MAGPAAVDYSFGRPALSVVKSSGYLGAMRYLDWLPNGKVIDTAEQAAIWAAGLKVGLVWESSNERATASGRAGGVQDATEALRQANILGWPASRPIYFVLEDPSREPVAEYPTIEDYARGAASVMGVARTGGYGSQQLVEACLAAGVITWGWQVGNWATSPGAVSSKCHLYQRLTPTLAAASIAGDIDEDAVLKDDWGGWDGKQVAPVITTATIAPPSGGTVSTYVGGARTPTGKGYWLAKADGSIITEGDAQYKGGANTLGKLTAPIVDIAAHPKAEGYWLVGADGAIYSYGAVDFHGGANTTKLAAPVVKIEASPTGNGYLLFCADGGAMAYGDAVFEGSGVGK